MLRKYQKQMVSTIVALMLLAVGAQAQDYDKISRYEYNNEPKEIRIDRYLDAELWTNHSDGEYYEGDNISMKFRVNHDAFVAIYSIDTKGRVNLLFPSSTEQDNFVREGVTYRLPDGYDDYDLVVTGPEGVESIQIIASRERFPIPNWYGNSGVLFDWEDRHEFMDYLNRRYFVRYDGQKFAFDRTTIYVNEWEQNYFHPTYQPVYPSWTLSSNVYFDYPWGATVYVDGIYWGITPLYIPRIYVGWHTFSIYDRYGYCWESNIHVTHYNTVILNRTIIRTSQNTYSKYKKVRNVGYRNPSKHGYPTYKTKVASMKASLKVKNTGKVLTKTGNVNSYKTLSGLTKKYSRGNSKLVKSKRGYETSGVVTKTNTKRSKTSTYKTTKSSNRKGSRSGYTTGNSIKSKGSSSGSYKTTTSKRSNVKSKVRTKTSTSTKSSGYYQKKTGSSKKGGSSYKGSTKKSDSSAKSYKTTKTAKSSKSGGTKSSSNSDSKKEKKSSKKSKGKRR